jgi:predicted nucleic acid-binding protein
VIYLDSSAVVKLVRREPGSTELVAWLAAQPLTPLASSALVEVEVPRALRRHAPEALGGVADVLARLYRLDIDATIRSIAGGYPDGLLRSLDAVHLASAQTLAGPWSDRLTAFVAYDERMNQAAAALGLPVVDPARP